MMTGQETTAEATFKEMEQAGWEVMAPDYDALAGQITMQATDALLDAAKVTKGTRLLDVACGPGYGAGAAAARGAEALGIDFADSMVAEATRKFPGIEFQIDDAEKLSFEDDTFDAVICPFGLLHMEDPDSAIREAFRVLKNKGRYAFSTWTTPETHEFFAIVLSAIEAHGTLDVPLPPAPPLFRFSDAGECTRVLNDAGFVEPNVTEVRPIWKASSGQQVLDFIYKCTVRTAAMLRLQSPEALDKIHREIVERAEVYKAGSTYDIAWPAVIASGSKP
jgi:ubiquinone/menaquinone biosynthesis C-methylase UbiE